MNKVEQSKIPCELLSDCVGPINTLYPNEPLGSQAGTSLFEPPGSFSLLARNSNNEPFPRKALSTTFLRSDQRLSRKRMTCRKTTLSERMQRLHLNQSKVCKTCNGCIKSKCGSAKQNERIFRKSATKVKPVSKVKLTVVKRRWSSLYLSKIHAEKFKGQLGQLKHQKETLCFNKRILLNKIEDDIAKNEHQSSKSHKLRIQVKNLIKQIKKSETDSKQRENVLKIIADNQQKKLALADKLGLTLESGLQKSEDYVAQEKMRIFEVDKEMAEPVVKIEQLERNLAAQQDELHHADKLITCQNTEPHRANEKIEKQEAELRVADEETVKQLEKIQKTFTVVEEREHSFEEAKVLSERIVASLKEKISTESQNFDKIEKELEVERNTNIALQVQIADLKNQLAKSYSQSTKVKKHLEFKNRQLFNENKQLRKKSKTTKNRLKSAEEKLQNATITRDSQFKQTEEQSVIIEKQNAELQGLNSRLLSLLNTTKANKSTQTSELINRQHKTDFDSGASDSGIPKSSDVDQETNYELCSPDKCACAKSNERNATRFLWLMKECAQLKDLVEKFELEHRILAEKTNEENEKMRNDIDRLSKESLRKDKELDMMESSLEELGKVKNCEILGLKQVLRRLEGKYVALKKELTEKSDKTKIFTIIRKKGKSFEKR